MFNDRWETLLSALVSAAAGSTLQEPFIHESRQDQLAVASSVSGSTLQQPFIHSLREDQLAVPATPAAKVVAAPDRTPAARVPAQPSLDDVIVLDGSEDEKSPAPARPAVVPPPSPSPAAGSGLPAWLRGALPVQSQYPAWLRAAAPTVLLLQPIYVPVPVSEAEVAAVRRQGLDYYGAADPARLRGLSR
ncbi:hypothetical protein FJT64_003047 [Amphibalanus amphitrite]|uniref:Uncharacterized protein n=1 Tax=Amphibalanus amphitrite TaxID=1232801 RepID=A0A6A4WIB7_AMPAM|nr:hypothetical protein FJT64_003047 [Amphibalanus amphitrite]